MRSAFVVILLVGLAALASADVYSWTDEDGVAHFTNIKPQGGKWKKVLDSQPPKGSKAWTASHNPPKASTARCAR